MGKRPFDDFYADFARCTAEIGYSDDGFSARERDPDELTRLVIRLQNVKFYREVDHQKQLELQADIGKCEFHVQEVKYLGLIVGISEILMDASKVSAVVKWPWPANVKDVQSFLGFANFHQRFIRFLRSMHHRSPTDKNNTPFD